MSLDPRGFYIGDLVAPSHPHCASFTARVRTACARRPLVSPDGLTRDSIMAYFMTRIELRDATRTDYLRLHEAMQAQGFSGQVKGKDGKMLRLPTGQYRLESKTLSVYQVLGEAMTAARTLGKKFAAVTTQGSSAWTGLEEVAANAKTAKKAARSSESPRAAHKRFR